jgi:protein tyrosine/serine phosphatase
MNRDSVFRAFRVAVPALAVLAVVSCDGGRETSASVVPRPAAWAVPMPGKRALPNLHRVDDTLYRGAQPGKAGFEELEGMGVRTVVNVRNFSFERSTCERSGLDYVSIPMRAWSLGDEEVIAFLRVALDPARQPVFVHCKHGADRVGALVAAYRVVVQGWSREEAVEEMTEGGYGFHRRWQGLVEYVRTLDADAIRAAVGLPDGRTGHERKATE